MGKRNRYETETFKATRQVTALNSMRSIEGGGKCDTMKGKLDEDHNEGNKGKKGSQETERENVLSSNTPNFEKFYVQKVQESFFVPFYAFHLVPLFS